MKRLIGFVVLGLIFLAPALPAQEAVEPAGAPVVDEAAEVPMYKCIHCDMVFEEVGKCPHCGAELTVVVGDAEATKAVAEAAK